MFLVMHSLLYEILMNIEGLKVTSSYPSSVIHLRLIQSKGDRVSDEKSLQQVVDQALVGGVMITRAKYVHDKEQHVPGTYIAFQFVVILIQLLQNQALEFVFLLQIHRNNSNMQLLLSKHQHLKYLTCDIFLLINF